MRTVTLFIFLGVMLSLGCTPPSDVQTSAADPDHEREMKTGIRRVVTGHDGSGIS